MMKSLRIEPHYSPKISLRASLLLPLCLLASGVWAAGEYTVENVIVDATGKDTTAARSAALAAGEKDAFAQLITRLNPKGAPQIIARIPPAQISTMVGGYSVTDEKMTADHYHATLTYNFNPATIQTLVPPNAPPPPAAAPAASTTTVTTTVTTPAVAAEPAVASKVRKAVLVLPVYSDNGALELWQDNNKWRNDWYEAALESGGGLVVVPLGDFNDRVDVDDTNVSAATADSLKRMAERYGVGDVIALFATFNQKADPKPALEVTLKRISPGKTESSQMSFTIHSTENLDALLVRASNEIARSLYKQQTIDPTKIEFDRLKEIRARVNTTNIAEWEALRKRLLTHGNIVGIKFLSISYYETTMTISYKGTPDMLGKTLVASGLRVMQDGDDLVLGLK